MRRILVGSVQWLFVAVLAMCIGPLAHAQQPIAKGESGLPLPRFVSLKAQPVNMRRGPGTEYPIAWVLRRAGMPLEVLREYEGWREVRDMDGTTGWILGTLLSGRRTAAVANPAIERDGTKLIAMFQRADDGSRVVAQIEVGGVLDVASCDGTWCRVSLLNFRGYVRQNRLWGIYPGETID